MTEQPPTQPDSINSVCVYCGSRDGNDSAYLAAAKELGAFIAQKGWELVYGGGLTGLMGALADSVLEKGGTVTGVRPAGFLSETAHYSLTQVIETQDRAERINTMTEKAHAFFILPGGPGTYEEFFIELCNRGLGDHKKPIILLNIEGYFDPLLNCLAMMKDRGFSNPHVLETFEVVRSISEIPNALAQALQKDLQTIGEEWKKQTNSVPVTSAQSNPAL